MIEFDSQQQANKFFEDHKKLISKITKQYFDKVNTSWDVIYSMALEGFALAIKNYNPEKSKLSFAQYAAYSMRNQILTSLSDEMRVVKLSNYAQEVMAKKGFEYQFTSISLDVTSKENDNDEKTRMVNQYKNACILPNWSDGNIYEYLYTRIENKFKERDCQIFYMIFGLKGYDIYKSKDVAKKFKVTEGCISQRIKIMIQFIRQDKDLCEMLSLLCE